MIKGLELLVIFAQHGKYTKHHGIAQFKMIEVVNFMLREFYLKKIKKNGKHEEGPLPVAALD